MTTEEITALFAPLYNSLKNLATMPPPRPLLAHYTTLAVLEKIVKSDELWFSNPLFMNDLQEMRFGMQEGVKVFEGLYAEPLFTEACESKERADIIRGRFHGYYRDFDLKHALDVYVFCLSEHDPKHTDGLLSMWRGYRGNGNGVALIFNTDFVASNPASPLLFGKVQYETGEKRVAWIADKFRDCLNILKSHAVPDEKLHLVAHQMFDLMKFYSLLSKHRGFSEEKEWRLVYLPERDVNHILTDRFDYVIGTRGIEPKLKFKIQPLPTDGAGNWTFASILHQIILGPGLSSHTGLTIGRMLEINKKTDFIPKVLRSGIPLRSSSN